MVYRAEDDAYLVVVNGAVLWARAPDLALPPASLTKIMTALLVLERWAPDDIVTVSRLAAAATGSRLGPVSYTHLRAHETVLDLVCRLLLEKKKKKL